MLFTQAKLKQSISSGILSVISRIDGYAEEMEEQSTEGLVVDKHTEWFTITTGAICMGEIVDERSFTLENINPNLAHQVA